MMLDADGATGLGCSAYCATQMGRKTNRLAASGRNRVELRAMRRRAVCRANANEAHVCPQLQLHAANRRASDADVCIATVLSLLRLI